MSDYRKCSCSCSKPNIEQEPLQNQLVPRYRLEPVIPCQPPGSILGFWYEEEEQEEQGATHLQEVYFLHIQKNAAKESVSELTRDQLEHGPLFGPPLRPGTASVCRPTTIVPTNNRASVDPVSRARPPLRWPATQLRLYSPITMSRLGAVGSQQVRCVQG